MKNLLLIFCLCAVASICKAQVKAPRPSPGATISQDLGLTEITLEYYRPKMNGRKIFGNGSDYLVPFNKLWRTGANAGSTLTLSDVVTINGEKINAGKYLIVTKPGKSTWKVMLCDDPKIGGDMSKITDKNTVATWTVSPKELRDEVKTMTFSIDNVSKDNTQADLVLKWEKTAVSLLMKVNYADEVLASIEKYTKVDPNNYASAAKFYYDTNRDLNQALKWINLYLAERPNAFWNVYLKAQILAKMNKKSESIATAKESIKLAKANESGDFGYIKRNESLIKSLK